MLKKLSPYPLWAILSILPLMWGYEALYSDTPRIIHRLVHPTGEFAARLLIFTLMITPLAMLFKGTRFAAWGRKNRRYFGVASFVYALQHTVFYIIDKGSFDRIISELDRTYIWTGWVAFIIFVPLALTSMDYFVRIMGPRWKTLQRTTYVAAVFTLVHWAAIHRWGGVGPALVHFAPLIALEIYRVTYWIKRRKNRAQAAHSAA